MEDRLSQKKIVLQHMRKYGSIEPLTALSEYGIYRLGARIGDLRAEGYKIVTDTQTSYSRITGRPVYFAKYRLEDDIQSK